MVEDGLADLLADPEKVVSRVATGNPCPESGWWFTPAKQHLRRLFQQGEVFPAIEGSDYGATFWQWDWTQN